MLALVKTDAGPGLDLREVPEPTIGINDVLIRVHKTGICGTDLHIDSWDAWAAKTIHPPLDRRPRVRRRDRRGRQERRATSSAGDLGQRRGPRGRAAGAATAWPAAATCAPTRSASASAATGRSPSYVVLPMTNVWHHWPGIDEDVAAIFDPFGNAVHTALAFPVLGEDVLVTGAGPIGLMATAVARHAGARHVVVSEPNAVSAASSRCGWARRSPSTRASATSRDVRRARHGRGLRRRARDVGQRRGAPGRDRGMAHGGGIAILGIPTEEIPLDVNEIVFKMLTLRGIYGREMYETWYKMTVMLQSGLDIRPAITHRFSYREYEAAFAAARQRRLRQGRHGLDGREPHADRTRAPIRSPSSPTSWPTLARAPPVPAAAGDERRPGADRRRSTSAG